MRTQNSYNDFHITYSKWKIWVYSILCWILAVIPLLVILLFTWGLLTGKSEFTSSFVTIMASCGSLFLLMAALGTIFLTKLNKPLATLTRNGFSGLRNLRQQSFTWSPNTVIYNGTNGQCLVLANLDSTKSRMSKLWSGPKAAVAIHNSFAKQNRQDILEAINRLSPYPVKQTTLWGAAMH